MSKKKRIRVSPTATLTSRMQEKGNAALDRVARAIVPKMAELLDAAKPLPIKLAPPNPTQEKKKSGGQKKNRDHMWDVMRRHQGHMRNTASELGLSPQTISYATRSAEKLNELPADIQKMIDTNRENNRKKFIEETQPKSRGLPRRSRKFTDPDPNGLSDHLIRAKDRMEQLGYKRDNGNTLIVQRRIAGIAQTSSGIKTLYCPDNAHVTTHPVEVRIIPVEGLNEYAFRSGLQLYRVHELIKAGHLKVIHLGKEQYLEPGQPAYNNKDYNRLLFPEALGTKGQKLLDLRRSGLSVKQISDIVGIKESSVYSQMSRTKKEVQRRGGGAPTPPGTPIGMANDAGLLINLTALIGSWDQELAEAVDRRDDPYWVGRDIARYELAKALGLPTPEDA